MDGRTRGWWRRWTRRTASPDDFDRDDEDAIGGYDAIREVRARRARERSQSEATTSEATFGEDDSAGARSRSPRERDATSADGDEGYALPHAAVSEEDAQYLYSLTTMLTRARTTRSRSVVFEN